MASSSSSSNGFAFVSWHPKARRTGEENFQIRSHCMKGKNKRADSRRSKREAKRAAQWRTHPPQDLLSKLTPPTDEDDDEEEVHGRTDVARYDPTISDLDWSEVQRLAAHPELHWQSLLKLYSLPSLVQVDPGTTAIAKHTCSSAESLLQQITMFLRVSEVVYLAETFVDFVTDQPLCPPPLDVGLVHGILLVNSVTKDISQHRPLAESTQAQLSKALRFLNERLAREEGFREDTTVWTIVFLAVVAGSMGDHDAVKVHMAGLRRIVRLRTAANDDGAPLSPKMRFKLKLLDLVWALRFGGDHRFLIEPITTENMLMEEPPVAYDEPPFSLVRFPFLGYVRPHLARTFHDLEHLVGLINTCASSGTKMNGNDFSPLICSIQTRLVGMERTVGTWYDDCLCLAMLAFNLSMFKVITNQPTYEYLSDRIRGSLRRVKFDQPHAREIATWLLMVSALSAVEPREPWLRAAWADVVGLGASWDDVLARMKAMLWIGAVHDGLGKAAFKILNVPEKQRGKEAA